MPLTPLPSPRRWAMLAAMLAFVALVFAPGLSGGFLFDDYPTILQEPKVHLEHLDWDGLKRAAFAFHPQGGFPRPLAGLTYALNHVAGGLDPFGFKLTNLAIHLGNTVLLYAWLAALLGIRGIGSGRPRFVAACLALLWAIHPLQVSTVLYVVQRMEMLWVSFALISLLFYTLARRRQMQEGGGALLPLSVAAAAIPLGMLAKESAVLIPFLLLSLECLIFRFEAVSPHWRAGWRWLSLSGIAIGATSFLALSIRYLIDGTAYASRDFSATARLLSQLEILPSYIASILWPRIDAMTFYYDHLVATDEFTTRSLVGGIAIIALIAAASLLRKRRPWFSFGVAFFLLGHLLTSSTIPLELAFEHRNYLPLLGILLVLYGLLPHQASRVTPHQAAALVGVLAVALGSLAFTRSATWGNQVLLAHTLVEINPNSTRASMDLGEQYMLAAGKDPSSPWYQKAVDEFERASRLPQGSIMGEHGLLLMNADFGLPADPAWWARMEEKLSMGPVRPQEVEAITGIVEQRLSGLPLDGTSLSRITLVVARRVSLSPELLALYGKQAFKDTGASGPAAELFARSLASPRLDTEFKARIRRGISALGGEEFLASVESLDLSELSTEERGQRSDSIDKIIPSTHQ